MDPRFKPFQPGLGSGVARHLPLGFVIAALAAGIVLVLMLIINVYYIYVL